MRRGGDATFVDGPVGCRRVGCRRDGGSDDGYRCNNRRRPGPVEVEDSTVHKEANNLDKGRTIKPNRAIGERKDTEAPEEAV